MGKEEASEWAEKYAGVLRKKDRDVFYGMVERAGEFGPAEDFYGLIVRLLVLHQMEIERVSDALAAGMVGDDKNEPTEEEGFEPGGAEESSDAEQ